MNITFPFQLDSRQRTALDEDARHVRGMIEQVLLTEPGERVNRPDFGCGLRRYVFAGNSPEASAALELSIRSSLQGWLGDLLSVKDVVVTSEMATLQVQVDYVLIGSDQPGSAIFTVATP